ncbi:4-amino-4-deoxy-L-arabinose-phosphoundecaprenol flippase subunit ArnE [Klebsiella pneumoniae RYC492]|nr:4-amino-4-deoxy-L-arabinose-phosphoundecaprenol flippase subunit ArnE [Klebsiella pneumoniae RYC492]
MSVWICLVCASLLSCAGQLCQKQATRPSRRGRRSRHILFWLGMALLCLGCGMLLWLSVLQSIPVSIAYPMLSLISSGLPSRAGASGMSRSPVATGLASG